MNVRDPDDQTAAGNYQLTVVYLLRRLDAVDIMKIQYSLIKI